MDIYKKIMGDNNIANVIFANFILLEAVTIKIR